MGTSDYSVWFTVRGKSLTELELRAQRIFARFVASEEDRSLSSDLQKKLTWDYDVEPAGIDERGVTNWKSRVKVRWQER